MISKLLNQFRIAQSKAAAGELPVWRQLAEMVYLFGLHGLGPGYYLMGRFWRRGLPFSEKANHWNGRRYLRFVHQVNDPRYFKISQNKLVEKSFLSTLAIPTSELIGLFHVVKGQARDGRSLTSEQDLRRVFEQQHGKTLFFKPAEGDSGRGVFAVTVASSHNGIALSSAGSGAPVDMVDLLERISTAEGYVIEQAIEQHPTLRQLNPSSVNTLRMWVVDDAQGSRVVGAFLRVGRKGSLVDNTAAGGLACAIDIESGKIRQALDLTPARNEYVAHPDSGVALIGLEIPQWQRCMELTCTALRVLPGARFAGMDIAVAPDGPVVVEYNVEPNQQGAAHFDVPHGVLFSGFLVVK